MKKQVATMLRGLATMLDPPAATPEKRHHPALKPPDALRDLAQPASVDPKAPTHGGAHLYHGNAPGRWGGPYL